MCLVFLWFSESLNCFPDEEGAKADFVAGRRLRITGYQGGEREALQRLSPSAAWEFQITNLAPLPTADGSPPHQ